MLLKNSYYTLEITSHIWLKKTDDLFDFDSENKLTKYYSLTKEDKENYIICYKENSEETNDIISPEALKEKLVQNLTTKVISVLLFNNSTLNFSIINSLKRKNRENIFTPKNCERIWTVIPQNDYSTIKEGDIIKLGRLRLKFDKIYFINNKNNKSEYNNLLNSRVSNSMININTNLISTSNDFMPNMNNNLSEELTKNNFMLEPEKEKETIEKIYCRLCYQEESTVLDPLLCPCKCKGSMKYIHFSCLKKSIMQKIQIKKEKYFDLYFFKSYNCEICLETYPKYIKYKTYIYNLVDVDLSKYNEYVQASIIYYIDNNHLNNSSLEYENKKQLSYLGYLIFNIDEKAELKVGRNQNNEIVLKDISISRFHCVFKRENNTLKVKDTKSKFGTLSYIKNTKQIDPDISPLMLVSGKHQFIFNLIHQEKMFGFLSNFFGIGCCSCNKKEKNEFVMEKNAIKKNLGNEVKEVKSNWNDSLVEFELDSNDYYKRFKDNDSYNDYVINMESIIGINDKEKELDKENNYFLDNIIFEK
jgi:hypothetical protein